MTISKEDVSLKGGAWNRKLTFQAKTFNCGYCGDKVSSGEGYYAGKQSDGNGSPISWIRICPGCQGPTVFTLFGKQFPGSVPGRSITKAPEDLIKLYDEARYGSAAGAYTGAVLICRKILMNIAVAEGAKKGLSFLNYVEFLAEKGFIPPRGEVWVDYIRKRGNEANHEIDLMEEKDATGLIIFVEMLLQFIYEFPQMVPTQIEAQESNSESENSS